MHRRSIKRNGLTRGLLLFVAVTLLGVGTLAMTQINASAAIAPTVLGTAQSFAVLGGSTVTNTGPSVITGANLGVSPGSAITGFPPGIVTAPGTIHATDAVAAQAQSDVTTAYNVLAGQSCTSNLPTELGGLTLTAGVYCQATAGLTGTLTLDAQGNPNAVFVFKTASTLITASNSAVRVINGGSTCNVYWQVSSSATIGTNTAFVGNVLALTSITANTGATVIGRALARNGAVTLDNNRFTPNACATTPTATPTNTPSPTSTPIAGSPTSTPVAGAPTSTPIAGAPTSTPIAGAPTSTPIAGAPSSTPVTGAPSSTPVAGAPSSTPVAGAPVIGQPGAPPIVPSVGSPVVPPAAPSVVRPPTTQVVSTPSAAGQYVVVNNSSAPVVGNIVTGPVAAASPVSATLPLVGSPANAAVSTVPIPVAMSNTGGGGMATHFTTLKGGVGDSSATRLFWMSTFAMLVVLTSTGLLFFTRRRR